VNRLERIVCGISGGKRSAFSNNSEQAFGTVLDHRMLIADSEEL